MTQPIFISKTKFWTVATKYEFVYAKNEFINLNRFRRVTFVLFKQREPKRIISVRMENP